MPGDSLFGPLLSTDELLDATGARAWLQAMLDAEAALAGAEADAGIIPADAAAAIAAACDASRFDAGALGRAGRASGNPVIPLVEALAAEAGPVGRPWVHWGATSQDILDTAAMLIVARSGALVLGHLDELAAACAGLAERHRHTLMAGRTLLQQALPITFGLKAAGWLVAVTGARRRLARARAGAAVQLGGGAGTLAALGSAGVVVTERFAARLALDVPVAPWHTDRQRVVDIASALATAAATAAKIAGDIGLLMQTEVAEVFEADAGGSSTMPHKRNPVAAATARAAAARASALLGVLLGSMVAEHERALGGWQAEWQALAELLALSGGAVAAARRSVATLVVDETAMARNLERTDGRLMAERLVFELAPLVGRQEAAAAVGRCAGAADFRSALAGDAVTGRLGPDRIDQLLEPSGYLGVASAWIDRALADHRTEAP